jgi:hypothetical protein
MAAKAGIHFGLRGKANKNLNSGLRRNDKIKSGLPGDRFRTPRLKAEGAFTGIQGKSLCLPLLKYSRRD